MNKTITVKGIGNASARPDYVVISMALESTDKEYSKAMEHAAENITLLTETLVATGFEKEALKTTNFNVRTDYDSIRKKDGSYESVFRGYVVSHNLKIEFDFKADQLSKALSAIGSCTAHPQMSIAFTVKDPTAINEEMLRAATMNARRKAKILCEVSGKKLGDLLSIDYNWGELNIFSNTRYDMAEECMAAPMMMAKSIDFEPDDIDVSDTATFVWEIA